MQKKVTDTLTIGDHLEKYLLELPERDKEILENFKWKNKTIMKWEPSRLSEKRDFTQARKRTSEYIKGASFRNREEVIRVLNKFFGWFEEEWRQVTHDEHFCIPEYAPYELDIKLLKFLQSGEDEEKKLERDEKIAKHFSVSLTKIHEHLSKLQNGIEILGSKAQIQLRRGKNTYDSTVHPIFMTLNLSEVYFLTVVLKKYFPKDHPVYGNIVDDIANDIYSQLSDYAKEKYIDPKAIQEKITFDKQPDDCQGYRRESYELGYFLKGSCLCKVFYMDWGDSPKICRTLSPGPDGLKVRIEETGEEEKLDYQKIINIKAYYE